MSLWDLTIRSPRHETREIFLPTGKALWGRNPHNDIVIIDESASRVHTETQCDPTTDHLTIRDRGITNGT